MEPAQGDPLGFTPPSTGGRESGEQKRRWGGGDPPYEVAFWGLLTPGPNPLLSLFLSPSTVAVPRRAGWVTGGAGLCPEMVLAGWQFCLGRGPRDLEAHAGRANPQWEVWALPGPGWGGLGSDLQEELGQASGG